MTRAQITNAVLDDLARQLVEEATMHGLTAAGRGELLK